MVPGEQAVPRCRTKRWARRKQWARGEGGGTCQGWMWWWQLLLVDCAAPLGTASKDVAAAKGSYSKPPVGLGERLLSASSLFPASELDILFYDPGNGKRALE